MNFARKIVKILGNKVI